MDIVGTQKIFRLNEFADEFSALRRFLLHMGIADIYVVFPPSEFLDEFSIPS